MYKALSIVLVIAFISVIQYPYYFFERFDNSITIYQMGYGDGSLRPIVSFPNLGTMIYCLNPGVPMC